MNIAMYLCLFFGGYTLLMGFIFSLIHRNTIKGFDYKTDGQIVDVTPSALRFNEAQGHGDAGQRPKTHASVHAGSGRIVYLLYTYSVYGNHYTRADFVSYTENLTTKKIGKKVDVYYRGDDPSVATIRSGNGFRIASNILLLVGAALLVAALALWVL